MKRWLLVALISAATASSVPADESAPAARPAACLMLNNRILGPRSGDRPLPLLAGDPARGFRPACSVPWSTLSPKNQALPVVDCFRGNLLQLGNDSACGRGTGPLWVGSRWVVTSADLQQAAIRTATCQQLETHAWAGTRDYSFDCVPQKKARQPKAESSQPVPASGLPPATPAATPHPGR